jgi:antitoxin (DNA-binding transcriptional repressor) of toxin-antitoxin stability system
MQKVLTQKERQMRVAGISVDVAKPGRPVARLIVADDAGWLLRIEEPTDFTSDDADVPVQLHDAAEAVRSRLKSLNVDRVVVRRADFAPASRKEGPKLRLLMEGALTSAACSVVPDTRIGTGKDTGAWYGGGKEAVDAEASQLLSAASLSARYGEATSAALAGIALGP